MKNEEQEALEVYKIKNDALEILNEAYRAKIEALEMLNNNLKFLKEAKAEVIGTSTRTQASFSGQSAARVEFTGEKRGRGRPRKYFNGEEPVKTATPKPNHNGKKRGRKPKGYYDNIENVVSKPEVETSEKRGRGRPRKMADSSSSAAKMSAPAIVTVKKVSTPERKTKKSKNASITRLQIPLEANLRETLSEEGFNKATFRALTGILLCLFENGTATVTNLNEYIGGSRVTVVRHTALLKKMKLISYEGSRKKGYYALTSQGRHLHERLVNA